MRHYNCLVPFISMARLKTLRSSQAGGALMQIISRSLAIILLFSCANVTLAQENPRIILGRYHNPAEGFSVRVPRGLKGIAGNQAGPERGVMIRLGGKRRIYVYGEPNSLDWSDTVQAIRSAIEDEGFDASKTTVASRRLGALTASRVILQNRDRALAIAIAFRPGGDPVYRARLESDVKHFPHDYAVFLKVTQSFKLEEWK